MNQEPNTQRPQEQKTMVAETKDTPETESAPKISKKTKQKKGPNRKLRMGTTAVVLTVVVIIGVILLNVVVSILHDRFPFQLDLTSEDNYTLSESSIEVARSVDEDMKIVVFQEEASFLMSGWATEGLNLVMRQFYEMLQQYRYYADNHITLEFLDSKTNPAKAAEYEDYEVSDESILFLCGERESIITLSDLFSYDEYSLYYSGQYVVTESLVEQVLATNIRRVSGKLAPVILFTGHGENATTMANVTDTLEMNGYEVVEHDLTVAGEITADATTAVLAAPSKDFGDAEILKLRDWLQNDGLYTRHLVLLANYAADCPNLYEFLEEEYGIEVTDDIIVETKEYYGLPTAAYGTIASSDFTSSLAEKRVLLQMTRRLVLHQGSDTSRSIYNIPLATFGDSAKLLNLTDESDPRDADSYPIVGMAYANKLLDASTADITVESSLLVCGSQAMLEGDIRKYIANAENEALFMSVFNEMAGSKDNITISSRSVNQETLSYDAATRTVIIVIFEVALPLITLVIGLIVFLRRRHL